MATVYLAEDVRHHRRVAIKVLSPELSAVLGPERFLKEIELTANLQHPHILPLFDSGSADGLLYYVMPYVEGETLRNRLTREHQLPVADALRIATDVADALDYAHKRHVVHRDIKPENILLHDGRPLVADFGIALAVEQAGGSRMTQTGMSLGTPQYMAPEQAMGDRSVDHRADIYALGAVVFEMLAGEPPFTGPTPQAIVAKVMTERPRSLNSIRDTVSPQVSRAVSEALQKLPADRPATAGDFARLLATTTSVPAFEFVPAQRWSTTSIAGGVALTAVLFGIAGYAVGYRVEHRSLNSEVSSRLAMMVPNLGGTGVASLHRQIALTPDGSAVIYVAQDADQRNVLMYQRLDSETPSVIAGSGGVLDPLVSPDGKSVLGLSNPSDVAGSSPVRVPITGGTPVALPPEVNMMHADIGRDGTIWYSIYGTEQLRSTAAGWNASHRDADGARFQQLLPDGQHAILVAAPMGTTSGRALYYDVQAGKSTPITDVAVEEMRYAAGYVTYVMNDGSLWAAPFDAGKGRMTAGALQIGSRVSTTGTGIAQIAMAANGTVAYIPEEPRTLVFVDRDGKMRQVSEARRNYHAPKFSPDGTRISFDVSGEDGRDVWILSLARGLATRATFDRDGHDATWTPDGQYITYTTFKHGPAAVFRTRPGGGSKPDSLIASRELGYTGEWFKDGTRLVTTILGADREHTTLGIIEGGGKGPVTPLFPNKFFSAFPALSPDGKWVAYSTTQSGGLEVFVRRIDGTGDNVQVSDRGGTEPLWSHDGKSLFYREATTSPMLVELTVKTSPTFEVVSRKSLFPVNDLPGATPHANYDISPDDRTFVFVRRSPSTRVVVIQNLDAMVKSLRGGAGQNQ